MCVNYLVTTYNLLFIFNFINSLNSLIGVNLHVYQNPSILYINCIYINYQYSYIYNADNLKD